MASHPSDHGPSAGLEGRLRRVERAIGHAAHLLPAQAPLRLFVHHNTLHGLQHLPFERALEEAEDLLGARPFYPESVFREAHRSGRVTDADLDAAIDEHPELNPGGLLWERGPALPRREALRAALVADLRPTTPAALAWALEHDEVQPLDLWEACLDGLGLEHAALHPETLMELPIELAEELLESIDGGVGPRRSLTARQDQEVARLVAELFDGVGPRWTMRRVIQALTGQDLLDLARVLITRITAHQLDEGVAAWHSDERRGGLLWSFKRLVSRGFTLDLAGASGWRKAIRHLPEDPLQAIAEELDRLGLPEERWEGYLSRLALELPGWAGMVRWREEHPDHVPEAPARLAELLAIRLFMDNLQIARICREAWRVHGTSSAITAYMASHPPEALVRLALYRGDLPDHLAAAARDLAEDPLGRHNDPVAWRPVADMIWTWQQSPAGPDWHATSVFHHAWPLFQHCRALGLSAADLRARTADELVALVDLGRSLSATRRGLLWLEAYERNYRESLFGALIQRHGLGRWARRGQRPEAQVVCCIDDREEGLRRHLEAVWPEVETLGAAGFFGLAMLWRGLDDPGFAPLCPVNVQPAHRVAEVARPGQEARLDRHRRGKARKHRIRVFWADLRRSLLAGHLGVDLLAPFAAITLAGELLAPTRWDRLVWWLRRQVAPKIETEVAARRDGEGELGFTLEEQADRVAGLLKAIGLTSGLARLVVLLGHGSESLNNPHLAAYDCGACGGRHGGPNARTFARLANQPELRPLLAARGVDVPADTVFVGAEHNTADEQVIWYDLEDLPPSHRPDLERASAALSEAGAWSAHERCRRFASAPPDPSLPRAREHVQRRSVDIGQPRPELGHATNAAALVGRRAMTQGLFLDRRGFLISYDPMSDVEGKILEGLLSAVVPVCGGINLEYYFSASNDERLGCGTKVAHNAVGLFGVLDGTSGDLRTGLPRQMVEIHEAMRLMLVVEAETAVVDAALARQPAVAEWITGGWVQLAAMHPERAELSRLRPGVGWQRWSGEVKPLPLVARWRDWYAGRDGPLGCSALGAAHV